MQRYFIKESIQVTNTEKHLALLTIREMHIKTITRCYILITMAQMKKVVTTPHAGENAEKLNCSYIGRMNGTATL